MNVSMVRFLSLLVPFEPASARPRPSIWKTVVSMLGILTTAASAVQYGQYGNFIYTDNGSNITITDCLESSSGAVTVPSKIGGKPVVEIGSQAFRQCSGITSLVIPNGVSKIGSEAFSFCAGLTSVTLPSTISRIESNTFYYCVFLPSLTIPAGVTFIGDGAFVACSKLQSVNLPSSLTSIGSSAFADCYTLKNVTIPESVTTIGGQAFSGCKVLTGVSIPNGVVSLGESAFRGTGLKTITVASGNANFASFDGVLFDKNRTVLLRYPPQKTSSSYRIPDGVVRIATEALEGCEYLTHVSLPASCTEIGGGAFRNSPLLTGVNLPDGVTAIKDYTFSYCQNLGDLTLPSGVVSIGNWAFENSGLTGIEIPDGLITMGWEAFIRCKKLTRINVDPNNSTFASEDGVLFNKTGTKLIQYPRARAGGYRIPSGVITIGDDAFGSAGWLTEVVFPASLEVIGASAFVACDSLSRVTIPANVRLINMGAFYSCGSLTQVTFTGDAPTLGFDWFSAHPDLHFRYYNNRSGFSSPTWNGYPSINLGDWIDLPQDLVLEDSSGLELSNGGTMDAGSAPLGQPRNATLTIRNAGTTDLTGLSASISGAHADDYKMAAMTTDYLIGGESVSFQITFTPKATGPRTATLQISSNDEDESPFVLTLQGTGTAPEIDIEQPTGEALADGGSRVLASTLVGETTDLTFTIRNTGTAELTHPAFSLSGAHEADFLVTNAPNGSIPAGGQATFTVEFSPTAGGARSAVLCVASNDDNENPYDIHLTGKAITAPEITVEQPARSGLTDGKSKKSFGTAKVGEKGTVKTFTIRNTGSAILRNLKVTTGGRNAKDFVLTPPERSGLVPGATTTFKIAFKPTAKGKRSAAIHIKSNDADESPFDILIAGMGVAR